MNGEAGAVGGPIEADEVDRIAFEDALVDDADSVMIDDEIAGLADNSRPAAQAADEPVERGARLGLALFERGADDGRQVAHILGDEEIMFHEALDLGQAEARGVAEPLRDLRLKLEAQPLLRPTGQEVQMTAHRPQEFLAAAKQSVFALVEQSGCDEIARVAHPVHIFADPEERVEVADAALAVLDIGLDQVARAAGAL